MQDKKIIREQARDFYQTQDIGARAQLMQEVAKAVTALPAWQDAKAVALTLAQENELPTQLLIQTALLQKKAVYLPKVSPNHQLTFIRIDETTRYEQHRFGMLEPIGDALTDVTELNLIVVPGLAFSGDGQRVGFGGGYYDRLLAKYPQIPTIGIVTSTFYTEQIDWVVNVFDQTVEQVVVIGDGDSDE